MRKLVSIGALLFVLGVTFLSKPAVALSLCSCLFCSGHPTAPCMENGSGNVCVAYLCDHCTPEACL